MAFNDEDDATPLRGIPLGDIAAEVAAARDEAEAKAKAAQRKANEPADAARLDRAETGGQQANTDRSGRAETGTGPVEADAVKVGPADPGEVMEETVPRWTIKAGPADPGEILEETVPRWAIKKLTETGSGSAPNGIAPPGSASVRNVGSNGVAPDAVRGAPAGRGTVADDDVDESTHDRVQAEPEPGPGKVRQAQGADSDAPVVRSVASAADETAEVPVAEPSASAWSAFVPRRIARPAEVAPRAVLRPKSTEKPAVTEPSVVDRGRLAKPAVAEPARSGDALVEGPVRQSAGPAFERPTATASSTEELPKTEAAPREAPSTAESPAAGELAPSRPRRRNTRRERAKAATTGETPTDAVQARAAAWKSAAEAAAAKDLVDESAHVSDPEPAPMPDVDRGKESDPKSAKAPAEPAIKKDVAADIAAQEAVDKPDSKAKEKVEPKSKIKEKAEPKSKAKEKAEPKSKTKAAAPSSEKPAKERTRLGFALTVAGEVLVSLGVLVALFAVYDTWWTTVEASGEQRQQVQAFQASSDYVKAKNDPDAPHYIDNPPVANANSAGAIGTLHVPRWGSNYQVPIEEGVDKRNVLDTGAVGHYPNSQDPGELGNFAVAGHRITHGEPFAQIMSLKRGDEIIVETATTYYVYAVTDQKIVSPSDIDVIDPVPNQPGVEPTKYSITLTTCHPRYTSTHRYIVWGELQYWIDKNDGMPPELAG